MVLAGGSGSVELPDEGLVAQVKLSLTSLLLHLGAASCVAEAETSSQGMSCPRWCLILLWLHSQVLLVSFHLRWAVAFHYAKALAEPWMEPLMPAALGAAAPLSCSWADFRSLWEWSTEGLWEANASSSHFKVQKKRRCFILDNTAVGPPQTCDPSPVKRAPEHPPLPVHVGNQENHCPYCTFAQHLCSWWP